MQARITDIGQYQWEGKSDVIECFDEGSIEELLGQSALADHRAEGADGNILAGMRHNDRVAMTVPLFGMAAALRDETETIAGENPKKGIG